MAKKPTPKEPETGVSTWRWRIAKAKLEQGEFAANHAKINPQHLSMILNGKRNPRPLTVQKVEDALSALGV